MIYCNVKGGLGNMLFEIAATKSMAIDHGVDCSFPNLKQNLNHLNNEVNCNPSLKHSFEYLEMFKNLNMVAPTTNIPMFRFPYHFVKGDLPKDNFYIDGFFQSEKYFKHNRKEILELFKMPLKIKEIIDEKYGFLFEKKVTLIHVRRGEYLRLPNHHPVQTIDYYYQGIESLKEKTDMFMICSDDISWCKGIFNLDNIYFVENEKDYVELYLMSLATNHIISNSTFSWWGAWLSEKNNGVIAPKKWFGSAIKHNTNDVLPETWIKL